MTVSKISYPEIVSSIVEEIKEASEKEYQSWSEYEKEIFWNGIRKDVTKVLEA